MFYNDSTASFRKEDVDALIKQEIRNKLPKFELVRASWHTEFFRRPRSKKKRIIRKWAKRLENWRPAKPLLLATPTVKNLGLNENGNWSVLLHPVDFERVRKELGSDRCITEDVFFRPRRSGRTMAQRLIRKVVQAKASHG